MVQNVFWTLFQNTAWNYECDGDEANELAGVLGWEIGLDREREDQGTYCQS